MGFRNIIVPNNETANPLEEYSGVNVPKAGYFRSIEVGAGSRTFKMDERGIWMGSEDFDTAPFRVDMDGNIYVSSPDESGGYIRINAELNQIYLHDGSNGRILIGKQIGGF